MKQHIIRFTFAALTVLAAASCSDFIDLEPISDVTEGNFFRNGADAEAGLVAAYDMLQSEYYIFDLPINGDVRADNMYAGGDNPNNFQIDEFMVAATNGNVERDWRYLYESTSRANAVLDYVPAIQSNDLSEARKEQILGEAAFLRALSYFQLVNVYGGVPLVLHKVNSTDADVVNQPRASVAEGYAQIITDLEMAAASLPESFPDEPGRATRGAANALLAKAYAHQPQPDWSKVEQYAQAVINGPYSLLEEFDWLWDGNHENSAESIFEVEFIGGSPEANWGPQLFLPPSLTGDQWRKFNTPSRDLIEAFRAAGDSVRLHASILFEDVPWDDPAFPDGRVPFPYKQRNANGWSSPNNIVILRLADILLLQAEAKVELGKLEEAKTLLNQVRERAELPPTTAQTADELRAAIALERRLELAFEGHRWFDLKRTGRAVAVMSALGYPVNENKLVYPIPQTELDRNPVLVQNPGY